MRVVGGRFGGRILAPLGADMRAIRPTSERMRESLFNCLAHGGFATPPPPQEMRVLDLFAGTGALGIEALSRGAARVLFVEKSAAARALIRRNVEAFGLGGQVKIWRRDATGLGRRHGTPFDLVFLDPPYGQAHELTSRALKAAHEGGWLAPRALIALESGVGTRLPALDFLEECDARRCAGGILRLCRRI